MVSYCCVNGCTNNSSDKKKHPKNIVTFHAFPSNSKLRSKWLRAIGHPSWEPPAHARVCSVHFSDEQINREHQRTRLKDDACPIKELPEQSYEPPSVEVCRVCLAVDVKMYSLRSEVLRICFKAVVGICKDTEALPQYVCFECAASLLKCYRLVQKSAAAKNMLLAVIAKHGQITKHRLKKINRAKLNLESSLSLNAIVPKTLIELQYDEDLQKYTHTSEIRENVCKKEVGSSNISDINTNYSSDENVNLDISFNDLLNYRPVENVDENFVNVDVKNDLSDDEMNYDGDIEVKYDDFEAKDDFKAKDNNTEVQIDDIGDDVPLAVALKIKRSESLVEKKEKPKPSKPKKKSSPKNADGLTPEEVEIQGHFNIVIQTLQEQIEERLKMKESAAFRDGLYKCEICYKTYLHPDAYKMHMDHHDPSRGPSECVVCRARYGSGAAAAAHAARAHAKRFYCLSCPKVFSNVRLAKKHLRRHEGFVYKCDHCDFSTVHESAHSAHMRSAHAARHACSTCGHAFASSRGLKLHARAHKDKVTIEPEMFLCKECDLRFTSEEAWRVHMLTAAPHRSESGPDGALSLGSICPRCGERFASARELQTHTYAVHPRNAKKMSWTMPGDSYPTNCEHCGETVNNRKEHYFHVRRSHPRERQTYRPVVTAVCDTCGKGFQNSTKLHLHELRHGGAGTVRCPHCPRLFYDKYQLARHAGVHSDARPHACRLCDKAFKLRSNLDRHAKVHSGATPYECTMCGKRFRYSSSRNLHVRTVHYKLPQPPRKKRPAKTRPFEACPPIAQ